jgi:hypothetical protein
MAKSMLLNLVNMVVIALCLSSCKSSKEIIQKPVWLSDRPINTEYYIGIGSALKSANISEYQQSAKSNALNDLSGEISIQIANTSLLYKLSSNDIYSETYDSRTATSTNELLEGYELVETFEDHQYYWVYYRLSKQKYYELKQQRIQKALDLALAKYEKAEHFIAQSDYYNALIMLIKATEDIKQFSSETLLTTFNGNEIYFGNELYTKITSCINRLKLQSSTESISVKRGQLVKDQLAFTITDNLGKKIENIPVIIDYSAGSIVQNKARSSVSGVVSFALPKIVSLKEHETVTAKIDINELLQTATTDFQVKKMYKNIQTAESTVDINIQTPSMYISSVEKKFDKLSDATNLKNACEEALIAANFNLADKKTNSDFCIEISSNTKQEEVLNNMTSVTLDATLIVKNSDAKIVYQRNITSIKGTHLTSESANNDAYHQGMEYIKKRIIPDMIDKLF